MNITIEKAEKKDLPKILEIQHMAFRKEAEDFNDFNIEPMRQTVEGLEEEFKTFTILKAMNEDRNIIGSIRGYTKDGTTYIGKTIVHPDYQGHGIGTNMIHELEKLIPSQRYEINASIRCPQNIKLYERLDYVRFKEIKTVDNGFIYLEKK